jgi:zinc D-Ala-D-Ala carboxypeptidase
MSERISEHISWAEATKSQTATRKGIDNNPNDDQVAAMKYVARKCFEPVREWHGKAIAITSFYRGGQLNIAIGGSKTSQHCANNGAAIDIDADVYDNGISNKEVFHHIKDHLMFDQLIWEFGDDNNPAWVHVSCKKEGNRKEILIAKRVNGRVRYEHYPQSI